MDDRNGKLADTDRKASFSMMKFVGIIFVIALILAAVWFFVLTPGDPSTVNTR